MPLDPQQRETALAWLRDRVPINPCLICGAPEFTLGEIVHLAAATGGAAVPCLTVTCKECGNVRLFSAGLMGLVPQTETPST
jgi:predicted nucleic-acid-binding Zn-ribbon protein